MIEENILVQYGAVELKLEKGAFLFHEKERAAHYFQVKTGKMKMFNLNAEGKLFTQGIFEAGGKLWRATSFHRFKLSGMHRC